MRLQSIGERLSTRSTKPIQADDTLYPLGQGAIIAPIRKALCQMPNFVRQTLHEHLEGLSSREVKNNSAIASASEVAFEEILQSWFIRGLPPQTPCHRCHYNLATILPPNNVGTWQSATLYTVQCTHCLLF